MLSDFEKQIYNKYLIISRQIKGQPFKKRKNFDNLEDEIVKNVKKLSEFFEKHLNVDVDAFFTAPHMVYGGEAYYPLSFYITYQATSCYTTYMKMRELEDPDNTETLLRLRDSLKFVCAFCVEHGQTLKSYQDYTIAALPCFVEHLKTHKINFFTLHALTFPIPRVESKILEFAIPDFFLTFQKTKNKFYASKIMREFSRAAIEKLNEKLKSC